MKTLKVLMIVTVVALFTGCASTPPKELVDARSAYLQASEGPAGTLVPAEVHKAHQALILAEESFKKEPDSYKTKDLAYVARRKAELAATLGVMAVDKARKEKADADFQRKQSEIVQRQKQELSDAERRQAEMLAAEKARRDLSDVEKQHAETLAGMAEEQSRKDLIASEKRTAEALAALAAIAAVKEEKRGLVVTLSGAVLFRSGESTLMPAAQTKLDQVAKALQEVRARSLIVEGHTDSQGSASYNQGLSQRRADAVKDHLVQRGYPADRIQARGKGEGSPIADNASPEGRANNRRVEIVIEREQSSKP